MLAEGLKLLSAWAFAAHPQQRRGYTPATARRTGLDLGTNPR
ncbi:hypothetical protein FRUB_04548 [Fimbriiglobus ruber]|uniref:Uncharacterized protein n=1 Tax=Fimbriiglobus ruber TaxID=1908690 RepID=A0A225DLX6_9BACT|nr:hypothetical protein FRUB_04548 [Fimbriiglobus ruber]